MFDLRDLFNPDSEREQSQARKRMLIESAKTAQWHKFDDCMRAMPDSALSIKAALIETFLQYPQSFEQKEALIERIISSKFDHERIFELLRKAGSDLDATLWNMQGVATDQDLLKATAILLAEYVRIRYCASDRYDIPYLKLLNEQGRFDDGQHDSIIALQNALVDYVDEKGPKLPLNRGAAILYELRNEEGDYLWTRKMSKIELKSLYSVTKGDGLKIQPQFL